MFLCLCLCYAYVLVRKSLKSSHFTSLVKLEVLLTPWFLIKDDKSTVFLPFLCFLSFLGFSCISMRNWTCRHRVFKIKCSQRRLIWWSGWKNQFKNYYKKLIKEKWSYNQKYNLQSQFNSSKWDDSDNLFRTDQGQRSSLPHFATDLQHHYHFYTA